MADADYVRSVADHLISQLERGTAPWQTPWQPGERRLPYNPLSGKDYRGINALWLDAIGSAKGYTNPRWMTYKQASELGGQVRAGERSQPVQYWMWSEQRPVLDAAGKPVRNEDGSMQTATVQLTRPKVFQARVFNAAQIDGLPPAPARTTNEWERHQEAERLLAASQAAILHRDGNRAYYDVGADEIVLPLREQFLTADRYYATALHELGHWTGHASRLGRDLAHPFGSEGYAKEELRAEIASLMLGDRLGIGHDPGQHAAYVASWIKALREDPREIFRAAADAEKIASKVTSLAQSADLAAALSASTRPVFIAGMEGERVQDPIAQDVLSHHSAVQLLDSQLGALGIGKLRPLAGGVSSVVLDAGDRVVRLGLGPAKARPRIPEVLQTHHSGVVGGIGYEILPKVDTTNISERDVRDMDAALRARGFSFSDPGTDNLGRQNGRLVVIDSGAVSPINPNHNVKPTLEAIEVNMVHLGPSKAAARAERTRLDIPFAEKDLAKAAAHAAGFKLEWDGHAKSWFAPPSANLDAVAQWLPGRRQAVSSVSDDPQLAFADALKRAGLQVDGLPEMDGQLRRVPVDGDTGKERSGAYVGYLDGRPAGFIQNHRTGYKSNWTHAAATALPVDTEALAREAAAKRAERQAAQEQLYEKTAALAASILAASAPATAEHPYLARKGVPPHGLRVATEESERLLNEPRIAAGKAPLAIAGNLLVPVADLDGKLWSLQHISPKGQKGFLEDGKIAGNQFLIGDRAADGPLLVGEGFATCASVHALTGAPVAVAFNANNLGRVAEAFRQQDPDRPLVIAGDNDRKGELLNPPKPNVGADKALAAAQAVNGVAALPPAEAGSAVDWNDFGRANPQVARSKLAEGMLVAQIRQNGQKATRAQIAELQTSQAQAQSQTDTRAHHRGAAEAQTQPAAPRQSRGRGR